MIKRNVAKLAGNQVVRFLFVGAWNTLFSYAVFILLYYMFSGKLHYMLILAVSSVIAITHAFFCHKFIVFQTKGNVLKEYVKFYGVYGISAALNFIFLPVLVNVLHWHPVFAQGFFIVFAASFSYFGHKKFSFKKNSNEAQVSEF